MNDVGATFGRSSLTYALVAVAAMLFEQLLAIAPIAGGVALPASSAAR